MRHLLSRETGQSLAIFAIVLPALIGMSALTLDVGRYFELRRQLQNAADAAAHAAALAMPDTAAASTAAQTYFAANTPSLGPANIAVSFPPGADERVRIEVDAEIGFLFAPVMGFDSADVAASAEAGAQLADVVVVLDRSGSMCKDSHGLRLNCPGPPAVLEPFVDVKDAAITFSDFFTPGAVYMGLVSYSTDTSVDHVLDTDFGVGSGYAADVNALHASGYTNIGGAIAEARDHLMGPDGRVGTGKVIVLLSDGIANILPDGSNCGGGGCAAAANYARNEATAAAAEGIAIYTIGLGNTVDISLMEDLAEIGSGVFILSPTSLELEEAFEQIARMVRVRILK